MGPLRPASTDQEGDDTVAERTDEDILRATLAAVAPGTDLRDGLERILRGGTGALIVLGSDRTVESISSGGSDGAARVFATAPTAKMMSSSLVTWASCARQMKKD